MSLIIKGVDMPQHAAVNGEKDTVYKCVILVHPDNSVELVIDIKFASAYDNGHNIQRYPLVEVPTPHGRLIDADTVEKRLQKYWYEEYPNQEASYHRAFMDSNDCVKDSPTIIEAEVSE